jgi:hypothetical protein
MVYKPDIDEVLTRHLGRVAAPGELWERIENPQVLARVPTRHAKVRALLVLATLLVFAVVFHKYSMTPRLSKAAQAPEALNAACVLCHAGG